MKYIANNKPVSGFDSRNMEGKEKATLGWIKPLAISRLVLPHVSISILLMRN